LFEQTLQVVENPDFGDFYNVGEAAERFRMLMTTGQNMKGHGAFRTEFYNEVIRKAKHYASLWKVCIFELGCYFWLTVTQDGLKRDKHPVYHSPSKDQDTFPPAVACERLIDALCGRHPDSPTTMNKSISFEGPPHPSQRQQRSSKKTSASKKDDSKNKDVGVDPLVTLAFDEAHTLTDRMIDKSSTWSHFSVIRHVLRGLHLFSLFSLFLSTTGKITQFTSSNHEDVSKRIVEGTLFLIQPFTDIGFDTLARKIKLGVTLAEVINDLHMAHLGRPLYVPFEFSFGGAHFTDLRSR
jgi:hypothetical protein